MFVVRWMKELFNLMGLSMWKKTGKILFLGLDNAGKTTMLHMLREGTLVAPRPTNHPSANALSLCDDVH